MKKLIWLTLVVTQQAWAVDGARMDWLDLIAILLMIGAAVLPFLVIGAVVCFVLFLLWKNFFGKSSLWGDLNQEDK